MSNRILDLSEEGGYLKVQDGQLIIERADKTPISVPFPDIAVLVVSNPQVTYTHTTLALLVGSGSVLIVCNERSLPVGMLLSLCGHTLHAEKLRAQISVTKPTNKRLWQQVVTAKIHAQASVLREVRQSDCGLDAVAGKVRSGDAGNVEAQAARIYWANLFGRKTFRRTPGEGESPNHLFDYGYAILRAMCARALVASGLTVALGIHHCHRNNCFCLADDMMEPYRPIIDRAVVRIVETDGNDVPLNKAMKSRLLQPLLGRLCLEDEWLTLFDVLSKSAASLSSVYEGRREDILLPARTTQIQE